MDLALNSQQRLIWHKTQPTYQQYLRETELFEIQLFWHLNECKQNLYLYKTE